MKITNKNASQYVAARKDFNGSHIFANRQNGMYAVFSYGLHWPMFIFDGTTWYENNEKYSVTTSKQHGQCHPHCETVKLTRAEMRAMLNL